MDLLGDLFVLGLILLSLWTFVPKQVRESVSGGAGPTIHALADMLRQAGRVGEQVAYRLVVGHDRPTHNLSSQQTPTADRLSVAPVANDVAQPLQAVATPCNDIEEPLPVAQHEIDQAVIRALARLIDASERKPFHQGQIGETRAIELLFECKRSSDEAGVYQTVRRSLKTELEKLRGPVYREG